MLRGQDCLYTVRETQTSWACLLESLHPGPNADGTECREWKAQKHAAGLQKQQRGHSNERGRIKMGSTEREKRLIPDTKIRSRQMLVAANSFVKIFLAVLSHKHADRTTV